MGCGRRSSVGSTGQGCCFSACRPGELGGRVRRVWDSGGSLGGVAVGSDAEVCRGAGAGWGGGGGGGGGGGSTQSCPLGWIGVWGARTPLLVRLDPPFQYKLKTRSVPWNRVHRKSTRLNST